MYVCTKIFHLKCKLCRFKGKILAIAQFPDRELESYVRAGKIERCLKEIEDFKENSPGQNLSEHISLKRRERLNI